METHEEVQAHSASAQGHAHPGPAEYIKVAVWLAVVTALEVGAYYLELYTGVPDELLVVVLSVMMVIKFFLVAMWFMHLRFDAPIFRTLFVTGIILAIAIYTVVLVLFGLRLGV